MALPIGSSAERVGKRPVRLRVLWRHPWIRAGCLYLAITLAMAVSFIDLSELASASFAGDGRLIIWTIAWSNHALLHGRPLFDANMFYPAPHALAYTEHMLGLGLLALPLTVAHANPVLVFSLLWLAAFWTNAMAAHLLAFRFTGRHLAAFAAGLVFAWSFFRMSHIGHLQLQWTAWMPLSMWLFERWHERPTWTRMLAATAVTLVQMLTSWYLAVIVAVLVPAWLLWLCVVKPPKQFGRWADHVAVAAALSAAVLVPLALPYLAVAREAPATNGPYYAADLAAYLGPPEDTWVGRFVERTFNVDCRWIWGEQTLFLGWIALLLAAIGAVSIGNAVVRNRGAARREAAIPLFFVLLVVFGFWLSLGPSTRFFAPFDVLAAIHGLSLFRAAARFGLLVVLGIAILSAIGLTACCERLELRGRRRLVPVLVGVLSVAMLAEWRVVTPVVRATPAPVPAMYSRLQTLPPGAVVSLPDYRLGSEWYFRGDYLLYATTHWRPIVNGYGRSEPPAYLSIIERLSTFPSEESAALARTLGVHYFVVHTDLLRTRAPVEAARGRSDFKLIAESDGDYLFELTETSALIPSNRR